MKERGGGEKERKKHATSCGYFVWLLRVFVFNTVPSLRFAAPQSPIGLSDKDRDAYNSRLSDIDEMRQRIRDRAAELGVSQSSNSVASIGETQEAAAGEGRSSELDMSAFSKKDEEFVPKYMQAFSSAKEGRELTDEEKLNADPYSNLNILQAMWEESKLIEWPKPGQVVKQAVVTAVSLILSVVFIVGLDSTIKVVYQGIGLYPK